MGFNGTPFNDDQLEHMRSIAKLPDERVSWCGWGVTGREGCCMNPHCIGKATGATMADRKAIARGLTAAQQKLLEAANAMRGYMAAGSGKLRTARALKALDLVTISPWTGETRTTTKGADVLFTWRRLRPNTAKDGA